MKNFIFISPEFPHQLLALLRELKKNGINVLGIGDQPYDELSEGLKDSLAEYYKVSNLENDDEVYRAVAFLTYKHGPHPLAGVQQRVLAGEGCQAAHGLQHHQRLPGEGYSPDQI